MRGPRTLPLLRGLACTSWLALGGTGCSSETASGIGETGSDATATTTGSSGTSGTSGLADDTGVTLGSEPGNVFLPNPDLGEGAECDVFAQDCSAGFKCMPWGSDGGDSWDSTRCSPIADDPAGIDEPCRVPGSPTAGLDDCELGAMCWSVDPATLEGICVPLCEGSESSYFCSDPDRICAVADPLAVCLPVCHPLRDDCDEGQVCQLQFAHFQGDWQCVPDASGAMGGYGDPCALFNECDSGLVCLEATLLPTDACEGSTHCCTEVCEVDDPAGDDQCMGAAGGQACIPFYLKGDAPLGFEDVGVCAVSP